MFEPSAESIVLEIVCGIFNISDAEMMKIGDATKKLFFSPGMDNEEEARNQIKAALSEMSQEQALISGVFLSGLLRCNLAQQAQQCMQEMSGGCQNFDSSDEAD